MESTVVRTTGGAVRGATTDGITAFRGIPYAAPPAGALRFAPPAPPRPWDGVRDALAFGPVAPQPPPAPGVPPVWRPGDGLDCLTVNVWTPDPGAAGLPVMVWVHGGGWRGGSGGTPMFDGAALAAAGVVVVTFNYRVGIEGFAHVPGAVPNRGLRDQLAALEWVRDNAAAFGGDPDRVTAFGQSAGAASIAVLTGLPAAGGLFARAIAQSVPGGFLSPGDAARATSVVATAAGVPATRAGLASVPPERLVELLDAPLRGRPGGSAFGPVVDGELVTGEPWEMVRDGAGEDVDLICGFTHDESRLLAPPPGAPVPSLEAAATSLGLCHVAADGYRATVGAAAFTTLMSDALFRMPTTWVAEAHVAADGRVWAYDLAWDAGPLGACHTLDLPLVFGTLGSPLARRVLGDPPPPGAAELSASIRAAWTSFAAGADPGWPEFTPAARTHRTWSPEPGVADDPIARTRLLWPARRM